MTGIHQFKYEGWDIEIQIAGIRDGFIAGHADLYREGQYKCRIALATSHTLAEDALVALRTKARLFIDDWQTRGHTGNTGFDDFR